VGIGALGDNAPGEPGTGRGRAPAQDRALTAGEGGGLGGRRRDRGRGWQGALAVDRLARLAQPGPGAELGVGVGEAGAGDRRPGDVDEAPVGGHVAIDAAVESEDSVKHLVEAQVDDPVGADASGQ
jgi:hypothetical protein